MDILHGSAVVFHAVNDSFHINIPGLCNKNRVILGIRIAQRSLVYREMKNIFYHKAACALDDQMPYGIRNLVGIVSRIEKRGHYQLVWMEIRVYILIFQLGHHLIIQDTSVIYWPCHAAGACQQLQFARKGPIKIRDRIIHDFPFV